VAPECTLANSKAGRFSASEYPRPRNCPCLLREVGYYRARKSARASFLLCFPRGFAAKLKLGLREIHDEESCNRKRGRIARVSLAESNFSALLFIAANAPRDADSTLERRILKIEIFFTCIRMYTWRKDSTIQK
jgi:hypothetical protein